MKRSGQLQGGRRLLSGIPSAVADRSPAELVCARVLKDRCVDWLLPTQHDYDQQRSLCLEMPSARLSLLVRVLSMPSRSAAALWSCPLLSTVCSDGHWLRAAVGPLFTPSARGLNGAFGDDVALVKAETCRGLPRWSVFEEKRWFFFRTRGRSRISGCCESGLAYKHGRSGKWSRSRWHVPARWKLASPSQNRGSSEQRRCGAGDARGRVRQSGGAACWARGFPRSREFCAGATVTTFLSLPRNPSRRGPGSGPLSASL